MLKGWFKSVTADKYLLPIREMMVDLLSEDSCVLDVGCGTGHFLFVCANKIKYGLGVDSAGSLIRFAQRKKIEQQLQHIEFEQTIVTSDYDPGQYFNYAVSCLFFHVLPAEAAVNILVRMAEVADELIIGAFCSPVTRKQKFLLWLDQKFTAHYANFRIYQQNGYMEYLIGESKLEWIETIKTFDPTIEIYRLKRVSNTY